MTQAEKPNLPIGFWLKKVDQLLTKQIDEMQASNGVSRIEWQTLNMLYEVGDVSKEKLHTGLATFIDLDELGRILSRFTELGWVDVFANEENNTRYQLNEQGRRRQKTISQTQQQARQLVMKGISEDDYSTVIRVLQQISKNLEGEGTVPEGAA